MNKKTKLLSLISTSLAGLALSLGVVGVSSYNKKSTETQAYYTPSTHYEVSDTASELASYYSSISDSDSGTSLLSKLQSLNSSKRKKTMGYSTIGTDMSGAVIYTDYDLNNTAKDSNGQTYGTKVASFYTKTAATSWNREHMWPNSHGGNNVEADILHTRPTISSENSSRGNSFYVEGKNNSSSGWDPYTAGYAEWCRGECARVILYCVVAYPSFTLSDADSHSTSNSNKDNMMGNMNTLIKWHFNYLPNVYEKNRNDGAEYLQGNRNPFVDHPEYVARIWSNFNSTVSSLCSSNSSTYSNWVPGNYCNFGSNTPVQAAEGVTISSSTASISIGSTTTLSATSTDSGTITWTTSNSSVASISSASSNSGGNITITGVSAGTATITAKRTISGKQYSATCTVTVTKVVSSLSKGSTSPSKTTYTAGESFNPSGLTITANYSDSTSEDVTNSVIWSPDPLTAGTTSVTGTFGGKSITITGLTVNEAAQPQSYSIVPSDLANGTYPTSATSYTAASGISVTAMNTANFSSKIQFKKNGGYLYNNSSLNLGTLTLSGVSGSLTVYAGTSKNPSSTTISGSNGVYNLSGYNYFKIINNSSNVASCSSISVGLAQQAKTLSSISVYESPDKLSYTVGEYFDPTGLEITRTYSDGTEDNYAYAGHTSEFTFSPSTSTALTTSNTSVTITYGGKSCNQSISVAAKTLSGISASGYTTNFTVGDMFSFGGSVTATFNSGNEDVTSSATFSGYNMSTPGNQTVTVSYTYGGTTKTTTYQITVSAAPAKTLSSISVSGQKTSFTIDDSFTFGGTVTATFSDSTNSNVTASATFTGYDMSIPGNQTVTVSYTYGGTTKTTTYQITVKSSGGSGGQTEEESETLVMSEQGFTSGADVSSVNGEECTVSFAKNSGNNGPKYYDSGTAVRVYPNNTITVSSTTLTIIEITFTFGSGDGSNSITSSPSGFSSPTWSGSANSVVFTIGGTSGHRKIAKITITYEQSAATITSIEASTTKTFYVGEKIYSTDITVISNLDEVVDSFEFANEGYQFRYEDASSGGSLTNKTLTNAISAAGCTCSLTVQVQRKEKVETIDYSIIPTDLSSTSPTTPELRTAASGLKFNVYKAYNYSSSLRFTSNGYIENDEDMSLKSIKLNASTLTYISVKITNTKDSWPTTSISGTNYEYNLDGYSYVRVTSNYTYSNYMDSIVITAYVYDARNLANYIMYEDTQNQCTSKLELAMVDLNKMSADEKSLFENSDDYVISTARERLEAWAKNQGKTIDYTNGKLNDSRFGLTFNLYSNNSTATMIAVTLTMCLGTAVVYILIRKKTHIHE